MVITHKLANYLLLAALLSEYYVNIILMLHYIKIPIFISRHLFALNGLLHVQVTCRASIQGKGKQPNRLTLDVAKCVRVSPRCIELANSIELGAESELPVVQHSSQFEREHPVFCMARSLYDLRQFKRASYVLRNCESDEAFFLRNYCIYLVKGHHQ